MPVESRYEKGVLARQMLKVAPEHVLAAARLGAEFAELRSDPAVVKYYVELTPPSEDNNVSDMGRLGQSSSTTTGWRSVGYRLRRAAANWRTVLRAGEWKVTATVVHDSRTGRRLTHVEPGDTRTATYCLAIDIGTTTIHGALLDVNSGKEVTGPGTTTPRSRWART